MRLSETFPGEEGKERIITAYLNEIFYGHGAYGIAAAALDLLRRLRPGRADAGPGRAARRRCPSRPRRSIRTATPSKDDEGRLVVPPDAPPVVRRDWILDGLAEGARWTKLTQTELAAALRRAGRPRRRPGAHLQGRPLHVAGPAPARGDPRRRRGGRDRRLPGHHHARLEGPAARREVADRRRDRPQRLAQEGRRAAEVAQDPQGDRALDPRPARQGPAQRRAGRPRLPDRRRAGLRRQRRLLPRRPDQPRSSRPSTTPPATVRASPARRSSRSSTRPPSMPRR